MNGSVKYLTFTAALLTALTGLFLSCEKNTSQNLNANLNVANDNVLSQRPVMNTFHLLVRAVTDPSVQQNHLGAIDGTIILYYPDQGRYLFFFNDNTGTDHVLRAGKIEVKIDGNLYNPGTKASVRYMEYSEDGVMICGLDSLFTTAIDGNVTDFLFRSASVDSLVKPEIGTMRYTVEQTFRLYGTGQSADSYFQADGTLEGISSGGFTFNTGISAPVIYRFDCPWIHEGEMIFTLAGAEVPGGSIRFPGGSLCSDSVYYNFGGFVYPWRMGKDYLWE